MKCIDHIINYLLVIVTTDKMYRTLTYTYPCVDLLKISHILYVDHKCIGNIPEMEFGRHAMSYQRFSTAEPSVGQSINNNRKKCN